MPLNFQGRDVPGLDNALDGELGQEMITVELVSEVKEQAKRSRARICVMVSFPRQVARHCLGCHAHSDSYRRSLRAPHFVTAGKQLRSRLHSKPINLKSEQSSTADTSAEPEADAHTPDEEEEDGADAPLPELTPALCESPQMPVRGYQQSCI